MEGPRPCGRGGFKHRSRPPCTQQDSVPARVGGVDLSAEIDIHTAVCIVPARVGGVDLSVECSVRKHLAERPRPCGRGGFKLKEAPVNPFDSSSPPVWAGWI